MMSLLGWNFLRFWMNLITDVETRLMKGAVWGDRREQGIGLHGYQERRATYERVNRYLCIKAVYIS